MFEVWVKGIYHLCCPKVSFDKAEQMQQDGWQLIWDSAPSEFKGAQYAAQNYDAPVPYDLP